ncbi:MAG: AEC family transporter [Cellulosilyticaceae bacterium]
MSIRVVMQEVMTLFLVMIVGVYGRRKKIITEAVNQGLSQMLLRITMPLLIIASFNFTYDAALKACVIKAFYYSFFTLLISVIISYILLLPLKNGEKYILQFANVFSNCGFIGFPLIGSVYGDEGIIYAAVFNMMFSILVWTYGIALFSGKFEKSTLKKVMVNPAVVAVYIGLVIMIFNIKLPNVILAPIKLVGGLTAPLAMIIVGVILAEVKPRKYLGNWSLYYGAFIKLLVIPSAVYGVTRLVGDTSTLANTMVLLAAIPSASITAIFAENFNKNQEYASMLVFLTTLLSMLTFPAILKMIGVC